MISSNKERCIQNKVRLLKKEYFEVEKKLLYKSEMKKKAEAKNEMKKAREIMFLKSQEGD